MDKRNKIILAIAVAAFCLLCDAAACTPNCVNLDCGGDGCIGSCGTCPTGNTCSSGACISNKVLGDINNDNNVNASDLILHSLNYGKANCGNTADLDNNCIVDIFDLVIVAQKFTAPSNQPYSCLQLNGGICNQSQTCTGSWLSASDTLKCCSKKQCVNSVNSVSQGAYKVGVDYHSINNSLVEGHIIPQYHDPVVRAATIKQIQGMADSGAIVISTRIWAGEEPNLASSDNWYKWHVSFPLSSQEMANIKQFTKDVASIKAKDGHYLELEFVLLYHACAGYYEYYKYNAPNVRCKSKDWNSYISNAKQHFDNFFYAVGDVYMPDRTKAVKRAYFDGEIGIVEDAGWAYPSPNVENFIRDAYPYFIWQANQAGIEPSMYFFWSGAKYYSGGDPLYNANKVISYLDRNNIQRPARLDLSLYLFGGGFSKISEVDSIVHDVIDGIQAAYPNTRIGIAEADYPKDDDYRAWFGQAFVNEFQARGVPEQLNFWTTPSCGANNCDAGYPFDINAFLPSCKPKCTGIDCGSDGCGGSCGRCSSGSCQAGKCVSCAMPQTVSLTGPTGITKGNTVTISWESDTAGKCRIAFEDINQGYVGVNGASDLPESGTYTFETQGLAAGNYKYAVRCFDECTVNEYGGSIANAPAGRGTRSEKDIAITLIPSGNVDITGTWEKSSITGGQAFTNMWTITQSGSTLSGKSDTGSTLTGAILGNIVSLTSSNGYYFEGTVSDSLVINGAYNSSANAEKGTWTATILTKPADSCTPNCAGYGNRVCIGTYPNADGCGGSCTGTKVCYNRCEISASVNGLATTSGSITVSAKDNVTLKAKYWDENGLQYDCKAKTNEFKEFCLDGVEGQYQAHIHKFKDYCNEINLGGTTITPVVQSRLNICNYLNRIDEQYKNDANVTKKYSEFCQYIMPNLLDCCFYLDYYGFYLPIENFCSSIFNGEIMIPYFSVQMDYCNNYDYCNSYLWVSGNSCSKSACNAQKCSGPVACAGAGQGYLNYPSSTGETVNKVFSASDTVYLVFPGYPTVCSFGVKVIGSV